MTFLWTICLLSILVASGASRQCKKCHNFGDGCNGYDGECPSAEDLCGSVLIDTSVAPVTLRSIHKSCFSPAVCQLGFISFNVGNGVTVRARVNCCPDTDCPILPLPGKPLKKENGLYCPGCIGLHTHDCIKYPTFCTGSETKCIDLVGQRDIYHPHVIYNIKGCASSCPSLTAVNESLAEHENGVRRFTCTEATKKETLRH